MPFTKVWSGSVSGDYEEVTNWDKISIRNAAFSWTASGSGTNEYYVRTAANGNPGFVATPPTTNGVYINGSAATKASLGSLAAGNWGYGDNDTLGYSTVYVRLSGGGDPDAQDADHVQFRQIPQATEHVRIPAGASGPITTNLDQSAVAIGDFIVEDGCQILIGTAAGYLIIDPDRFEFNSLGQSFINLHSANISARILGTASANTGERGLHLRGSNLAVLSVEGGTVGLASLPGETSTVATIRLLGDGTSLWVGNGVTLSTALDHFDGTCRLRCTAPTIRLYRGELTTEENGAVSTAAHQYGGTYIWNASGTITAYNMYAGTLDMRQSGLSRTLTAFNKFPGSLNILRNKEAVTITTETPQASYTESISV